MSRTVKSPVQHAHANKTLVPDFLPHKTVLSQGLKEKHGGGGGDNDTDCDK